MDESPSTVPFLSVSLSPVLSLSLPVYSTLSSSLFLLSL